MTGTTAALLAVAAAAQEPARLEQMLARCADDDLPQLLAKLHTAQHEQAVAALAAKGPRAHRWLFGGVRLPAAGADFTSAFGGFGPQSTWALPGLLEILSSPMWRGMAIPLLTRLGASARPALPLLPEPGKPATGGASPSGYDQLRRAIADAPVADVAAEPMPELERVDAAFGPALVAVISDRTRSGDWWRALQAAIGCGDETAAAAAAVLAGHCSDDDPALRERARELLLALRWWFAAVATLDFRNAAALPEPVRSRELRRAALARAVPLVPARLRWRVPGLPSDDVLFDLARSDAPADRAIAALSALLASATAQAPLQDTALLRAIARDQEPGGRFARVALASATAAAVAAMHEPFGPDPKDDRLRTLVLVDGEVLRSMPAARIHELLLMCEQPRAARRADDTRGTDLGSSIRDSAEARRQIHPRAGDARQLLLAVAGKSPAVLSSLHDLDTGERATLFAVLGTEPRLPAELHALVLDNWEPPPQNEFPRELSTVLAPAAFARLRNPELRQTTLAMLRSLVRWQYWADACEQHVDTLVETAAVAEPRQYDDIAHLLSFGPHAREVLQHFVVDDGAPPALRIAAMKAIRNRPESPPPCSAFVLAAMDSPHDEIAEPARMLAGYVQDADEALIDRLLVDLARGDPHHVGSAVWSLGRLRARSAAPWLRVRLQHVSDHTRVPNAIALLDIDERDDAGAAALRAGLASADAEVRQQTWRAISSSPGASACFLDEAMASLATVAGADPTARQIDFMRLMRIVESAAARRPDDARKRLAELTRDPDPARAQAAISQLQQLEQQPQAR